MRVCVCLLSYFYVSGSVSAPVFVSALLNDARVVGLHLADPLSTFCSPRMYNRT